MPRSTIGSLGVLTLAMSLTLALSGCGGGGGVGLPRDPQPVVFPLPSGHGLRAVELVVAAGGIGKSTGMLYLTCPARGSCLCSDSVGGRDGVLRQDGRRSERDGGVRVVGFAFGA